MKFITTYKSKNFNTRSKKSIIKFIIIHYTAIKDFNESLEHLCDLKKKVSSHFVISKHGDIYKLVNENKRAWHAGKSSHEGRENFNDFSIGIELEGTSNSSYEKEQYDTLKDVIDSLKSCYPMIEESGILGHCDISPDRKTDPGPLFDWTKLKEKNLC